MSTLPPLGQRVRFGRVDAPARSEAVYTDWVPEPSALQSPHDDVDPLSDLMFTTPGTLGEETLGASLTLGRDVLVSYIDYLGMGIDSYDWVFRPGKGAVLKGDIDTTAIDQTLTETIYERAGSHRDFDLYERTDRETVAAVSDSHVVFDEGEYAEENVRALVDTGRGLATRYADTDDTAAELFEAVGSSPFTWFGTWALNEGSDTLSADPIGSALSYTFDEDAAYYSYDVLFPADDVPSRAAIKDVMEQRDRPLQSAAVDIQMERHHVRVEMRLDGSTFRDRASDSITPHVTWSTEYGSAGETLRLTHLAGDSIDADTLVVHTGDSRAESQFSDSDATVGPGDSLTVNVSGLADSDDVRVVVHGDDGTSSATILHHSLDDRPNQTDSSATPSGDG